MMETEGRFQRGDMVVLNSGGPTMFVEYVDHNAPLILCSWRDKGGQMQAHSFRPASLTRVGRSIRQ
jgi:uncharacterized protein YodC (DUF2158 family)